MITKQRKDIIAELAKSYKRIGQLLYKCVNGALKEDPQYKQGSMMLLKILKEKDSVSQHEIAKELNHTDASVSRQISLLLKQGFISTKTDPKNRRLTLVSLTDKGIAALKKIESAVLGHLAELLTPLPDERIKQIIQSNTELHEAIINSKHND